MNDTEPKPAATVVLVREDPGAGEVQVLLLRRNARLVFHGGHWVFPGGRLDAEDYVESAEGGEGGASLEYPAALRAAVRETREEAGVDINPADLIHTAHWTTPPKLPRRFCTWFFLCPLREAVQVRVDNEEILEHRWISPAAALQAAQTGELKLPRPTVATLKDLAPFTSLDPLLAHVSGSEVRVFPENSSYFRPREMGCPGEEAGRWQGAGDSAG